MSDSHLPASDESQDGFDKKTHTAPGADRCHDADCCGNGLGRRGFLRIAAAGSAAAMVDSAASPTVAGPFSSSDVVDHFVPVDKKLKPEWIANLFARGQREFFSGDDLKMIGMPIGGLTTGQLYINGDGKLVHWDIFNAHNFSGYGESNYAAGPPRSPIAQGFTIQAETGHEPAKLRTLDRKGFPGVRFCGEYPIAFVEYKDKDFPIEVTLEAYSPFVPLNAEDSALPATVMQFTLTNTSSETLVATLKGYLENAVCLQSGEVLDGVRRNLVVREGNVSMVVGSAKASTVPRQARPPIVIADFEGPDYGKWKAQGEAFGKAPSHGTLAGQQKVSGFKGKGLLNTFLGGDGPHGKLASPSFTIERNYLSFLVGGGNHAGKTCMNLLVDGKVVRTATGVADEKLQPRNWNVRDLAGKQAHLEIVDAESGPWGHINIDQIELRDTPVSGIGGKLEDQPDFGTMALAVLDISPNTTAGTLDAAQRDFINPDKEQAFGTPLIGQILPTAKLAPGESKKITYVVAWHFPNRPKTGNFYAKRFKDAGDVVRYIAANFNRLDGQTRLWHRTWYDSSLPYWLLDRLFSTVSILATGTCQWWANGRFWAWEGVGCCHGTCAHVWNYEHAMARLFPQLERSVREMQDYNPTAGFDEKTGAVMFRGEDWKMWAGDSQPGTVLKAYREHLMSADSAFLKRLWPRIRKSLEFMIQQDGNDDGLVEGRQHNTYDIDFYGPNTMVGSLYLAALLAGEAMARELGDEAFAARCRKIFETGSRLTLERLYNGEYFVQQVDLAKHPKHQYGDGCLADQLFGQGWAHQVALGYVYPKDKVLSALRSIWKYCWAPDIGPQNKAHPPQRWFARPGEAGLFTCTWPRSKHLGPESVLYRDEVWTGIEYQVAGNMVWDGMLTEALAICRGVHERYHPAKHNPWNEIECGDHYSRAMASHGVFLALCGFEYHGPKGHLGFAPKITPADFRAAFTAAEGWGTIAQKRDAAGQTNTIAVHWGKLAVSSLVVELPAGAKVESVKLTAPGNRAIEATVKQNGTRLSITLSQPLTLAAGEQLQCQTAAR